ncbi:maleylacetate reductase and hydroxyquinol 1,2-dioxygenase domain-containing protein [Amycolatopsis acidiphila]|uniref:Iron-containing alcohol dehydrogenase n=1 Tax=Amycolatopsis acidiphila TaxID=715473 RepID=A0A558AAF4_9PSEU|nr:maleylacetate reductase and hydroxyquinol 1,2-dioxygenase domain-containing protein [Amycolatopsis acidiphila]TVT21239.1 iron-containing alcohol dehydrogenase [Amycolatopsis acidiphila]UIJ61256.1 maleylacetate reductase and hydroxyquinol 1,2-dioxygenase domain-containing protein [Amycolatopsis acidiphila]GHG78559.1 alcohol dehydrogenase [Amycolatopsis acidiphila]
MRNFVYSTHPARVVFGPAAKVREEVERLGATRVLLLSSRSANVEPVRSALGPLLAAEFDGAVMHTPVEVTEQALESAKEADCLVAVGGGSTTGLAKALAARTDLPQVILPTTYAGSEVTPVLGETENGRKTTRSSETILPETVIYDVELTRYLPVPLSVTSALNAMAHAVEALYSPQANPVVEVMALDAIKRIARSLPVLAAEPSDVDARTDLLEAAWLAGMCLAGVGMGLHHKLCHTLGGSFDLPHAETHTVVLPHAMAYNASAAPEAMARIAEVLGVTDAPSGVFDLIKNAGGPTSLRELGFAESDIAKAAELATAKPYPNPRELTRDGIEELLHAAWRGDRPGGGHTIPDLGWLTAQVVASFDRTPDQRVKQLVTDLVRHLHHYLAKNDVTQEEWHYAIELLTRTGHITTDTRQEFVLLSDVLGVSSAVDVLTNSRTPDTTASAVLGPFYVEGPPAAEHGTDIARGLPGTPLWVDVLVTDTEGKPVPDTVVDVWQSNEDGFYDVQLPDLDGPVLRARFHTDGEGRLRFWSILPSEYPIPDDGPVGQMLVATRRHPWRAPHLHFMLLKPGYSQLITQLFVRGGPYLDAAGGRGDTVFGVKDELVVDFVPQQGATPDGRVIDGEWRRLDFTFKIAQE